MPWKYIIDRDEPGRQIYHKGVSLTEALTPSSLAYMLNIRNWLF